MRLVKKTVNFDNHHVYHFYYGDERGEPGHDLDHLPLRGQGRTDGDERRGTDHRDLALGTAGSLDYWSGWLAKHGDTRHRPCRPGSAKRRSR